jgi:outer membrane protein assembly factor BamB
VLSTALDELYVGSYDSYMYKINLVNGEEIWKYKAKGSIASSATLSANGNVSKTQVVYRDLYP